MGTRDQRIDAYIERSAPFAQPILKHIRGLVHASCPEVVETFKWSFPHFEYKGILCSMAAFKEHCALGFWRGADVLGEAVTEGAMGHFGRITSVRDLPSKSAMAGYIRKAMALNELGAPVKRQRSPDRRGTAEDAAVPEDLAAALAATPEADATWRGFPPSHRREYVQWINGAKAGPTRERRIAKTVEWLVEGKDRNWKYRK